MRKYLGASIKELELIFAQNLGMKSELNSILEELAIRTTKRASILREAVTAAIASHDGTKNTRKTKIPTERNSFGPTTPVAKSPPKPSKHQLPNLNFRPTDEQDKSISIFLTGRSQKINAFAGTGKTSTLELISKSTERRGVYLASIAK